MINTFIEPLDKTFGSISQGMGQVSSYVPIFYYSIMAIACIFFLLYLFLLFILFKQNYKNSLHGFAKFMKLILLILSIIVFIISFLSLFLMITTTLISSYCEFNKTILIQTDFNTFLSDFGIQLEEKEIAYFNVCLSASGNGDLFSLTEVPSFDGI